ncbi:MAG: hypothetical protein IID44_02400 [Planctomycetes bacterium]|nr:hypothetical protein [Planctomycetota bacterium]
MTTRIISSSAAEGNPSILDVHLPNAIQDFNKVGRYDFLVLCFDAEESTPQECIADVERRMDGADYQLARGELKIIVQNRSIETWFLGNRKVLTRSPQSRTLARFKRFYDVSVDEPDHLKTFQSFIDFCEYVGSITGQPSE